MARSRVRRTITSVVATLMLVGGAVALPATTASASGPFSMSLVGGSFSLGAQATLARHADDPRETVYTRDEFAGARTHDPLWNAAQRQLTREGRMHNYLRMLWGKKILQWSATPRDALAAMIELNNKYALDGRNPNSYSGIFWVLGRYDRPWFPERPVYGVLRYMTSESAARKLRLREYLKRYGDPASADHAIGSDLFS